jgi:flagellar basal-body rod protein FlgB
MKLFDTTKIPTLNKALDAYSLRQKTTAANIANVETVGYRSKAVTFQEELGSASESGSTLPLATTDGNHLTSSTGDSAETAIVDAANEGLIADDPYASGVNNVDIDHEMTDMADTQLRYKTAAHLMTGVFRDLQTSIKGQQ